MKAIRWIPWSLFEFVWRWRHHPRKFVDLHLTGPDETELAGHQDTQKEAQEAPKMSTVQAVKEKQEAQVGIWVLVCHMRAILIDNVWLDMIFGDFTEIFHL